MATGEHPREPRWYTDGFHYLRKKQKDDGSWSSGANLAVPDTAFGILFLMRSTKKSIENTKGYDSGTLSGGQGLPRDLSHVHLRDGQIVEQPVNGSLSALLAILSHPDNPDFENLAADPRNIVSQLSGRARGAPTKSIWSRCGGWPPMAPAPRDWRRCACSPKCATSAMPPR